MEKQNTMQFTRTEVSQWYGLTERGLRYRFAKNKMIISNRILTLSDIAYIIHILGKPPFIPQDILVMI